MFRRLADARLTEPGEELDQTLLEELERRIIHLLREIEQFTSATADDVALARDMRGELEALLELPLLPTRTPFLESGEGRTAAEYLTAGLNDDPFVWGCLLGWWCVHSLGKTVGEAGFEGQSRSWIDEWLLGKVLAGALQDLGLDGAEAWQAVAVIKLLTSHQLRFATKAPDVRTKACEVLETLLEDDEVHPFLQVNRYQDVLWFNKQAFEQLLWWLLLAAATHTTASRPTALAGEEILACYEVVERLRQAGEESGYQVEELLRLVRLEPQQPCDRPRSARAGSD
jgi:hypothetical protein